jgi:hypothetical protein
MVPVIRRDWNLVARHDGDGSLRRSPMETPAALEREIELLKTALWRPAGTFKTKTSARPSRGVVTRTWLCRKESRGLTLSSGCGRCPPILEGFASEDAERVTGDKMALDVERIVDGGMNGQETVALIRVF